MSDVAALMSIFSFEALAARSDASTFAAATAHKIS
jgi:hypothetical protein